MRRDAGEGGARPPAFAIVADACAAAASGRALRAGTAAGDFPSDAAIIAMAERHRVSTQVLRLLAGHPGLDAASAARLGEMAQQRKLSILRLSAATGAVSRALGSAGIRHLVLKGPPLSQQLYGDLAARDCKDIDILVDPAAWPGAEAAIAELGFSRSHGGAPISTDAWRTAIGPKDISFRSRDLSVELEVHNRLFDNARLVPRTFDQYWADRESLTVGGAELPVLSAADEFIYLCGHGAACGWFRLKWLQDIARILSIASAETVAALAEATRALQVTPMVASAACLVEEMFDLPMPAAIHGPRSAGADHIVEESRRALLAPTGPSTSPSIGELWRMLRLQFALRQDWSYRRAVIARTLVSPHDLETIDLPRWASGLYYPLRPILFAMRRVRRGGRG